MKNKKGWYVNFINENKHQRLWAGYIEPLYIIWSFTYERFNPCYIAITIFGFGIEIGRWKKEASNEKE